VFNYTDVHVTFPESYRAVENPEECTDERPCTDRRTNRNSSRSRSAERETVESKNTYVSLYGNVGVVVIC